jgi:hypothetical protein
MQSDCASSVAAGAPGAATLADGSLDLAPAAALPLFGGRYRYTRTLRTGARCHVIEAEDAVLPRPEARSAGGDAAAAPPPSPQRVAIKVLHATPAAAAAGAREAAALRRLPRADPSGGAKVARLSASFAYGGSNGAATHLCLVLPRLHDSLRDRLRSGQLPTVRRCACCVVACARALTRPLSAGAARAGAAPPAQAGLAAGARAGGVPRGGRGARRADAGARAV